VKTEDRLKKIEAALHEADNLMRDAPEAEQDALVDRVLIWAITAWLPASQYFEGIAAYAVHPDDLHKATVGSVYIGRFINMGELDAETVPVA